MKIWTKAYRPFIMGGDVHGPVAADVPVLGPHDAGHGIQLFVAVSPSGKTFVAEGATGAIVGPNLEAVLADIAEADPAIMEAQIAAARKLVEKATIIDTAEFWKLLRADAPPARKEG